MDWPNPFRLVVTLLTPERPITVPPPLLMLLPMLFLAQAPSTPSSEPLFRWTSMKTTLMRTWGFGESRLRMTLLICRAVWASAMTTRLWVCGSTEMRALPTVPLLL